MQSDDRVHAPYSSTSVERQEQDGAEEDCVHRFKAHGHWRLVDFVHVGPQHGPADLPRGYYRVLKHRGAEKKAPELDWIGLEGRNCHLTNSEL